MTRLNPRAPRATAEASGHELAAKNAKSAERGAAQEAGVVEGLERGRWGATGAGGGRDRRARRVGVANAERHCGAPGGRALPRGYDFS